MFYGCFSFYQGLIILYCPTVKAAEEGSFYAGGWKRREKTREGKSCEWVLPPTEAVRSVSPGAPGTETAHRADESLSFNMILTVSFSLQDLCKDLHRKIDVVDETRYDMEMKVAKNEKEVQKKKWIRDYKVQVIKEAKNKFCSTVQIFTHILVKLWCLLPRFRHWIRKSLSWRESRGPTWRGWRKVQMTCWVHTLTHPSSWRPTSRQTLRQWRRRTKRWSWWLTQNCSGSKKHSSNLNYKAFFILQREEVTDWRKNVEAMSGMEGRKKLFNAGQ